MVCGMMRCMEWSFPVFRGGSRLAYFHFSGILLELRLAVYFVDDNLFSLVFFAGNLTKTDFLSDWM